MVECSKCNYDRHECPGCGASLPHDVDLKRGCCIRCYRETSSDGHSMGIRPCTCGHSVEWHQVEHKTSPILLLDSSCQHQGCSCGGYVDERAGRDDAGLTCSCNGVNEDGTQRACCTGHVRGCMCEIDWDDIHGSFDEREEF